jgi:hypothetical protein
VIVTPHDSPLATVRRLDARELVKHHLIVPAPETSARHILDNFFTKAGVNGRLKIVLEAQNAIQFVHESASNLGSILTTVSPIRLADLRQQSKAMGLTIREVPAAGYEVVHCARRIGQRTSPAATDFLRLVLGDAESFVRQPLHRRRAALRKTSR